MKKEKASVVRPALYNEQMTPKERRKALTRIIAGVVVVIIAIVSFILAFRQVLHREPGYYEVETVSDESAPVYAAGIKFNYYYEGSSSEIRTQQNELKNAYSSALSRVYKLLDAEKTYIGYVNIAYINEHRGEAITLDEDLFSILRSAYELTQEGRFNLFGGALYREWLNIRVLNEPAEADPLNDPEMAKRIADIAELASDPANFSFTIVDEAKHVVRFDVSDAYRSFEEKNEIAPCLDLGYLKEAYELQHVREKLEKAGYNTGYFTTSSGLSLAMSASGEGSYLIYGLIDEMPSRAAAIAMEPNTACAAYRSFDFEDAFEYYSIETANGIEHRHPHYSVPSGEVFDELFSACVVSYSGNAVEACIAANSLFGFDNADAAAAAAAALAEDELVAYIRADEPASVYVNRAYSDKLELLSPSKWSISVY